MNPIDFAALWIASPNEADVSLMLVRLARFDVRAWRVPFTGALWR